MVIALGSLAAGVVTYLIALAAQSQESRRDLYLWDQLLLACVLLMGNLAVIWFLAYLKAPGASLRATIESLFALSHIRVLSLIGFVAAGFAIPALAHFLVIRHMNSIARGKTPNKSLERTRER